MAETEAQANIRYGKDRFHRCKRGSPDELASVAIVAISVATRIEEVRNELEKMVGDLRDEMATRFNALADEVDAIKGDKQPRDEKEPLDPVILGIAQAYRNIFEDGGNRRICLHLRQAYRDRIGKDISSEEIEQILSSYGLDADA